MNTETTCLLINAKVKIGNKYKLMKVLKVQLFSTLNKIKHHLIGNMYYTFDTDRILYNVVERSICRTKPSIISKLFLCSTKKRKPHKSHAYKMPLQI